MLLPLAAIESLLMCGPLPLKTRAGSPMGSPASERLILYSDQPSLAVKKIDLPSGA